MNARNGSKEATPGEVTSLRPIVEELLSQGHTEEAIELLFEAIGLMAKEQRHLQFMVEKLRWKGSRRSTERIDPEQLRLLFEEFENEGETEAIGSVEEEAEEDKKLDSEIEEAKSKNPPEKKKGKRKATNKVVHDVEPEESEKVCPHCGEPQTRIGVDTTTRLRFVPGHFIRDEYRLAKYACKRCKNGVTTASAPPQVFERCIASPSVLSKLVVDKYLDHTPLHRLHREWKRHGATISVSTMSEWLMKTAEMVEGVVDRLEKRLLRAHVVRTDATGLRVLDERAPDHVVKGTIWCYVGDDRDVVFRYAETGAGEAGPWEFLAGRNGFLQADAASVFNRLFNGEVAHCVEVGCWCHGRRGFVKMKDIDPRVAYPLKLIQRMYRVETLADAKRLTPEARRRCRQERDGPILEKLKRWMAITKRMETPGSQMWKAIGYLENQWTALTQFLSDGRLSLDNNLCESQLRDIALGRKNYLFAGSHRGARAAATLYSLMRTCRQWAVNPSDYMTDLLTKIADGWPHRRLGELLPDRWAKAYAS